MLDAFLERYITVILFEMDYMYNGCHIVRDNLMGMVFQQDDAEVIKLYGLDIKSFRKNTNSDSLLAIRVFLLILGRLRLHK